MIDAILWIVEVRDTKDDDSWRQAAPSFFDTWQSATTYAHDTFDGLAVRWRVVRYNRGSDPPPGPWEWRGLAGQTNVAKEGRMVGMVVFCEEIDGWLAELAYDGQRVHTSEHASKSEALRAATEARSRAVALRTNGEGG